MHTTAAAAPTSRDPRVDALATRLLEEHGDHLLNIARRNSSNTEDDEEAFQEAFISFLRKFDPDGDAPALPWLILTLKRECWARLRTASREHLVPSCADGDHGCDLGLDVVPDSSRGPEQTELSDRVAAVRDALAQLKPDHCRCLTLKALGYSYKEIREITGWTHTKINRCMVEGRAHPHQLVAK
ncbi:MAG: RNA polymerase sigma factor [Solirubrobacterales bacterium]